jgi:hypothetical protein
MPPPTVRKSRDIIDMREVREESIAGAPAGARHALLLLVLACCACEPSDSSAQARQARLGARAVQVGVIQEDRIVEASGIAASRQHKGVFWTHNDGSDGVLFAIRADGSLLGSIKIDAKVRDWEDIAVDDQGNLYISDTGNNSENRKHVVVYRVREPDPATLSKDRRAELAVAQTWKIDFPDEPQNVESLIIWRNKGYLVFKMSEGVPAEVYSFDLDDPDKKASMKRVVSLPVTQPVTAADLSADGKHLAVLTRGDLWLFDLAGDIAGAPTAEATRFPVSPVQTEGCCFNDASILIIAESREIFEVKLPAPSTTPANP